MSDDTDTEEDESVTVDGDDVSVVIGDDEEALEIDDVTFTVEENTEPEHRMVSWGAGDTFSGSFEVEVEDGGMFESLLAGRLFESGMSSELAGDLDEVLSEESERSVYAPDPPDVVEELSVDGDTSEKLLKVVYQKLNAYQREYGELPPALVLGLPQFKAVESYTREYHGESAQTRLPVDEVVVVPGPQIHCVRDPYQMLAESVAEDEDD